MAAKKTPRRKGPSAPQNRGAGDDVAAGSGGSVKPKNKKRAAPSPGNRGGTGSSGKQPVALLRADPKNARQIGKASLEGLGASMTEFGDLSRITWNEQLGDLVCGHQRMKKLRAAKTWERTGPDAGLIVDPKTGEAFPIRVVRWDETKHRLAQIAANNPEIQGDFSKEAIDQLRALETDRRYHELRLAELAAQLQGELEDAAGGSSGNTDPDDAVEPPPDPISKRGDLWILGDHRLLCGDSTSEEDVRVLMGGHRAAIMATDPPYGVDYTETKKGMPVSGLGDAQERWGDIENDDLKDDKLEGFLIKVFAAAGAILTNTPGIYVWHPSGELNQMFRAAMVKSKIVVHRQIIWAKPGFVLTRSGMYHWAHETCFYGWRQGNVPPWYGEKNQTSVWAVGRDDGKAVHPTQKPVALFEIPMNNHTRAGEICYEPFSGSGSQIIAGERLGRRVFAMELSPRWVDAAVTSWEAFTGKKARRQTQAKKSRRARAGAAEADDGQ